MKVTIDQSTPELFENYVAPTYGRFRVAPVRGQGCWLWDEDGKKYLDFGSGIAVSSIGHAHPRLTAALHAQASHLVHCSNLYQSPNQGTLARLLTEQIMQEPGKVFFCNSGGEANETLYKLARRYGHKHPQKSGEPRTEIITFGRGFHGRSLAGISATAQAKVKQGFAPLIPGFRHLAYNDIDELRQGIREETVAILIEPIQGEGGINVATPDFLSTIKELCRKHNLLFLLDEIQCGGGRSGHLRGLESVLGEDPSKAKMLPDAVSWAKGMGGGFPFGAAWIRKRPVTFSDNTMLCDLLGPGSHGTTYGGSPLACAAVTAVLEEILEKNLAANAAAMGERLHTQLLEAQLPFVQDIRGKGLMLGLVLDAEAIAALPKCVASSMPPAVYVVNAFNKAKLLTVPAGPDVVRLLPPLNVTEAEIDTAVFMLKSNFEKLAVLQ